MTFAEAKREADNLPLSMFPAVTAPESSQLAINDVPKPRRRRTLPNQPGTV